jgi:hypothetical protein
MAEQWLNHVSTSRSGEQAVFVAGNNEIPTMGYVTRDACPGIGDDIEHVPGTSSLSILAWTRADFSSSSWSSTVSFFAPS